MPHLASDTHLPNYQDGSIVNLMSSLLHAFGGTSHYAPLALLPPEVLAERTNVVLLVIDGFGYDYLLSQPSESVFHVHLRGKITSVFPSTTAAGVTTFLTGLAPQQHAVTGWFMYLKEFGSVATSLLYQPRCCEASLCKNGIGPEQVYGNTTVVDQLSRQVYSIHHQDISRSDYNMRINHSPQKVSYRSLSGFLRKIKQVVRSNRRAKFIYAYWADFDTLCHKHGSRSPEVTQHYQTLNDKLAALVDALAKTDTLLIITADHGMIDTEPAKIVEVKHHPALRDTLILPLCGEPRVAYCYVRPAKTAQFEDYIAQHFSGICDLYPSETLIENQYFGLFEPDPRLYDRIGDYVLIMRENYIIKDFLLGEEEKFQHGNHGGVSQEEMFVPLIVI
ncbi:hypothetical protein GF339_07630 [candidate division KSB3 bacterium]|uniref:Phosphodiesterase n=1 Tax=candidate division KSB3 bacterium TaxID=2044937 RepID=A0A9D5JUU7_9BACT|nr:hypothetical protein [candidate division KSB3 bacterium]MBD3324441.1 hypothetical protein [candidate division KSB3 bacterium]